MKLTRRDISYMIREILREQFTIPSHSKHSGWEYYFSESVGSEDEELDEEGLKEIVWGEVGDDDRADDENLGSTNPAMY